MEKEKKEIELYYSDSAYYGVTLSIWSRKNGDTREKFISTLKEAVKEQSFLQKNIDVGELLDFIDTLSNGLNGDDLYKNVIQNYLYVEKLYHESYDLNLEDSFRKIVYENYHSYTNNETITLFGKLTPLLKGHDNFKEWFEDGINNKDRDLYCAMFNTKENIETLITYKIKQLEQSERYANDYKKQYEGYCEKINLLNKEINELTNRLVEKVDK